MSPAIPRQRAFGTGHDVQHRRQPYRIILTVLACTGLLLSSIVGAGPAGATTPTWSQMTVAQKESTMVYAMLNLLNQERAAYHLAPVTGNYYLGVSATRHSLVMASDNLMSHQCPGEAAPGTRIREAGYNWRSWGENIGWTTDETVTGILTMERAMFNEVAPNDGHRLNILGAFRNIGLNVHFDLVHHKVWYTQDFGTPM